MAVLVTSSLSPFLTSHAQPEPKRVLAAVSNFSLKASKEPKVESMALARLPVGLPPPLPAGPRISQNRAWLWARRRCCGRPASRPRGRSPGCWPAPRAAACRRAAGPSAGRRCSCRRRPCSACRGGSPSSACRCAARGRPTGTAAACVESAWRVPFPWTLPACDRGATRPPGARDERMPRGEGRQRRRRDVRCDESGVTFRGAIPLLIRGTLVRTLPGELLRVAGSLASRIPLLDSLRVPCRGHEQTTASKLAGYTKIWVQVSPVRAGMRQIGSNDTGRQPARNFR